MDFTKVIDILQKYSTSFLLGVRTTLLVSISGTIIGFIIGLIVGSIKAIKLDKDSSKSLKILKKIYDIISTIYIEIFRGTPMMVQAVFIYYFVYTNIIKWDKLFAAIFVISINTGAYMAEIIRGGIQSVDEGQVEAARALGMSNTQTSTYIVLPQAIKNAFPSIGNELIVNIKDSSVLMIISITDLMFQSSSIAGTTYKFSETYFISASIYLILTTISSIILRKIENKINHTKTSYPSSDSKYHTVNLIKKEVEHVNY